MSSSGLHTNRNFLLLWSGNATSLVGFHGVRIAYPLLVLAVTGSPAAAGWVGFAVSVPSLLFQIPAGLVADYSDRIRVLSWCQVIGLAATGLAAFATVVELPRLGVLIAVTAFIEGTVYAFVGLSELSAIRDVVSQAQRPAAFAFLQAEQPIALLIGRASGAAVYGVARWLPFLVNAISYVYCLVTLLLIRKTAHSAPARTDPGDRPSGRGIVNGVRVVWTDPIMRASTVAIGASNIVIQIVMLLIMVELKDSGRPAWSIGVVLGAAGVGGIIGAAVASRLTAAFPAQRVYQGALWAWAVLLVPIAVSENPLVLAVSWGGIGGVGVASNVALTLYRVDVIPEHTLGRVTAAMGVVATGAVALGALGAGYLLSTIGVVATRWTVLGVMLALALCAGGFAARPAVQTRSRMDVTGQPS